MNTINSAIHNITDEFISKMRSTYPNGMPTTKEVILKSSERLVDATDNVFLPKIGKNFTNLLPYQITRCLIELHNVCIVRDSLTKDSYCIYKGKNEFGGESFDGNISIIEMIYNYNINITQDEITQINKLLEVMAPVYKIKI